MTQHPPKIIKRYPNRKLYDTTDSCHVTLEDISEMVKKGEDVEVIDNETKEDLTAVTMAQIIFEEHKKKRHILPRNTLRELIQSGSNTIRGLVHRTIETGSREIQHVKNFVGIKIKPSTEKNQPAQTIDSDIKQLYAKIEALEKKLATYEQKKSKK